MNWVSYKIALHKLNSRRKKTKEKYSKEIEETRKTGNRDKIEEVKYYASSELGMLDDEISELITDRLISRAQKLYVPIPKKPIPEAGEVRPENEHWEQNELGNWHLKTKGIAEIRNLIRQEEKESREKIAFWISIIFGLIGAFTGLIAIIKSGH